MSIPQDERVNMEFSCRCKDVFFPTKLFPPSNRDHFDLNCVDVVFLQIGKINNDFLEAVVGSVFEDDTLVLGFIANVTHIGSSKFKEL